MKKFISNKYGISKMLYRLLMVLSLNMSIFLNTVNINAQDIPKEPEKVKANYREKVRFSRDTWIEFPDFDLLFLGTGVYTAGGKHAPITSYYFRIVKGRKETIIFWSSGMGDIGPIPFEFGDNDFMIEMGRMTYGREGEDQSFQGENRLAENELCISRRKKETKMNEDERYIADSIRTWVWSGFYEEEDIHEMIDDMLEGDVDEEMLRSLVKKEMDDKLNAEHSWPKTTDCDKIDAVFHDLHEQGIVALQNAGYTMSDGLSDIAEVLAEKGSDGIIGYCFYHEQDFERALAGHGLMLAFGDLADNREGKTDVGQRICATIRKNGLLCDWNGDSETRINISPLVWQRR